MSIGKGKKREEVGVLSLLPQQLLLFGLQWRTKGRFFILLQVFNTNKYHTFFWEYLNKFLSVFLFGYMNGVVTNLDLLAFKLILPFLRRYGVFLRRHCRKCHNPLYSRHRRLLWAVLSAVTAPTLIPATKIGRGFTDIFLEFLCKSFLCLVLQI